MIAAARRGLRVNGKRRDRRNGRPATPGARAGRGHASVAAGDREHSHRRSPCWPGRFTWRHFLVPV